MPKVCPSCGSKYIGGFKAGTQRVEELVQKQFPKARILRMDFDTTRSKDSFEKILQSFANQEADILIGTQMIVKGHDFPNVTLVGVLAADMSLHVNDFHGAERTFQLLTQAAGRAGRGKEPGQVVIQTYAPEHYAITAAKDQDYMAFYQKEIEYRQMMFYPPIWNLLVIWCTSECEEEAAKASERIAAYLEQEKAGKKIQVVGPADATISKVNDTYRKVLYLKAMSYGQLVERKDRLEIFMMKSQQFTNVVVQFDFNPMNGF